MISQYSASGSSSEGGSSDHKCTFSPSSSSPDSDSPDSAESASAALVHACSRTHHGFVRGHSIDRTSFTKWTNAVSGVPRASCRQGAKLDSSKQADTLMA